VTPTKLQLDIFSCVLNPERLDDLMQNSTAESLALINLLTKICNSPVLLKATADKAKNAGDESSKTISRIGVKDALTLLPDRVQPEDMSISGQPRRTTFIDFDLTPLFIQAN
jgi:DNA repair and recombination protein RAD54B